MYPVLGQKCLAELHRAAEAGRATGGPGGIPIRWSTPDTMALARFSARQRIATTSWDPSGSRVHNRFVERSPRKRESDREKRAPPIHEETLA